MTRSLPVLFCLAMFVNLGTCVFTAALAYRAHSQLTEALSEDPEMETQQIVRVRQPGHSDEIKITVHRGDTAEDVVAAIEAAREGAEPFKDCWVSGGTEYEVCTPAHLGEEHHNELVAELQETYPDEGKCEE